MKTTTYSNGTFEVTDRPIPTKADMTRNALIVAVAALGGSVTAACFAGDEVKAGQSLRNAIENNFDGRILRVLLDRIGVKDAEIVRA